MNFQLAIEYNPIEMGIPYLWAQKLCGLNFIERTMTAGESVDAKTNADQRNMSITIQRIREHFKAMIELCEQLEDIGSGEIILGSRWITVLLELGDYCYRKIGHSGSTHEQNGRGEDVVYVVEMDAVIVGAIQRAFDG